MHYRFFFLFICFVLPKNAVSEKKKVISLTSYNFESSVWFLLLWTYNRCEWNTTYGSTGQVVLVGWWEYSTLKQTQQAADYSEQRLYLTQEGWLTGNHEELLAHGRESLKGRRTGLIHLFCIGEYGRCLLKNRKGWMAYLGNKEQRFQPGECLVERVSVELNSTILSRVRRMVTNRREPGNHQGTRWINM